MSGSSGGQAYGQSGSYQAPTQPPAYGGSPYAQSYGMNPSGGSVGTPQSYGMNYGGNAFNFGGYPGLYGGGYGGGFFQPSWGNLTPNSSTPTTPGQPTPPNVGNGTGLWNPWMRGGPTEPPPPSSPTGTPPTGNFGGDGLSLGSNGQSQLPTSSLPSAGGGDLLQRFMQQYFSGGNSTPTTPTNTPPHGDNFTPPTTPVTPPTQTGPAPPTNPGSTPTPPLNASPKVASVGGSGITPINRAYDPSGDGYTGMNGNYNVRPNQLVTQALQNNPQAVYNLLNLGKGGDYMGNYTNAANALQGSGFGGGDFNTAFRNLLQQTSGLSPRALSAQYSGLPSYFTGGQ